MERIYKGFLIYKNSWSDKKDSRWIYNNANETYRGGYSVREFGLSIKECKKEIDKFYKTLNGQKNIELGKDGR